MTAPLLIPALLLVCNAVPPPAADALPVVLDADRTVEATVEAQDPAAADAGPTALFDGTDLSAWEKYGGGEIPGNWRIDGGALHFLGKQGDGGGGNIQTKEKFEDFDLRFDWKVAPGANSGVIYGVAPKQPEAPYMTGPEYQVLDDGRHPDGKNPSTSAGALYAMFEARPFKVCPVDGSPRCPHVKKPLNPVGEWNSGRIVKDGDSIRHYLNGEKVVDETIGSDQWNAAVANSKFKDWPDFAGPLAAGEPGRIVLQDHGDEVWFRNVSVRKPGDLGNSTPAGETGDVEAETEDLPAVDGGPAAIIGIGSGGE